MIRLLHLSTLILAIGLAGCVIDTVPLPEGTKKDTATTGGTSPNADESFDNEASNEAGTQQGDDNAEPTPDAPEDGLDRTDSINLDSIYYSDAPIELVGTDGALPGEGVLRIETTNSWAVEVTSTATGSFAVQLEADLNDTIVLLFTDSDGNESSATLTLSPGSVDAYSATATLAGITESANAESPINVSRNGDNVTLEVSDETLSPGIGVVVGNSDLGTAAFSMANSDGSIKLEIRADTGDELIVFAVEPAASRGGGAPISLDSP